MPPCDLCMPSKLDLRMQMAAWHSALSQQFRSKSPFSHHTRRHRTHQLWATNKEGVVSRQQRRCKVSSLAEERTNAGWKWNNNLASGTSRLETQIGQPAGRERGCRYV